jgi:hypothetical protein
MSDWLRIILAAILPVTVSIGGIVIAVSVTHHKEDALRGGALGTALALILMFIARNYGMKLYDEAKDMTDLEHDDSHAALTSVELSQRIETLRAAIVVDGDELKKLNWFLIAATAVSAFVCAFGDLIAKYYGAQ